MPTPPLSCHALHDWVPYTFELATYGFGALMFWHALTYSPMIELGGRSEHPDHRDERKVRLRWLSTLLWGFVFGLVIEMLLIAKSDYLYCDPVLVPKIPNLFPSEHPEKPTDVPLWIGIGWGVILYATTWTSQRLKQPLLARAVTAGLLAVLFDLALDPVASTFHVWHWPNYEEYATFYGVPFDNFICWFTIVFSYSTLVRLLFSRLGTLPWSTVWVPIVGAGLSILIVYGVDHVLPFLYKPLKGDVLVFIVVFAVAFMLSLWHLAGVRRHLRPSLAILAVPLFYHLVCLAFLLVDSKHQDPELVTLVALIAGLLIPDVLWWGWASLDYGRPVVVNTVIAPGGGE